LKQFHGLVTFSKGGDIKCEEFEGGVAFGMLSAGGDTVEAGSSAGGGMTEAGSPGRSGTEETGLSKAKRRRV